MLLHLHLQQRSDSLRGWVLRIVEGLPAQQPSAGSK
jgi:hypothetical protein